MPVTLLDSRTFRNLFSTQQIRDVFEDLNYVNLMMQVETALARAQSRIGIIPSDAGDVLTRECQVNKLE